MFPHKYFIDCKVNNIYLEKQCKYFIDCGTTVKFGIKSMVLEQRRTHMIWYNTLRSGQPSLNCVCIFLEQRNSDCTASCLPRPSHSHCTTARRVQSIGKGAEQRDCTS